jgi:hypothetical protein
VLIDLNKPPYQEINLLKLQKQFSDGNDCLKWLFKTRWPNGFRCHRCEQEGHSLMESRHLLLCKSCRYQVSTTTRTIFHKNKTPLQKWFWLSYRRATSITGVSISEMHRELEIEDYQTVWVMAHKICKAMADRDAQYKQAML